MAELFNIGDALLNAGISVWNAFIKAIPGIIAAILLVIIGWFIGKILQIVTQKLLSAANLDIWVKKSELAPAIGNMELSRIAGFIVKWYVILLFLAQAAEFLTLTTIKDFVSWLVTYIPLVLGAAIIIVIGLLIARYIRNKIEKTSHRYKKTIAVVVEVIVAYMALVMGLSAMKIDVTIMLDAFRIGFTALVVAIAIVLGIAFGLAFRKDAAKIIKDLKKEAS